jgi:hypothetical protein
VNKQELENKILDAQRAADLARHEVGPEHRVAALERAITFLVSAQYELRLEERAFAAVEQRARASEARAREKVTAELKAYYKDLLGHRTQKALHELEETNYGEAKKQIRFIGEYIGVLSRPEAK